MGTPKFSEKRRFGNLGEGIACRFLARKGFRIIAQNYLKKWGEIDIVAQKGKNLFFVEVKSVSRSLERGDVNHETDAYRPEENIHPKKLKRLWRAIESYLMEKDVSGETDWQIDAVIVYIDAEKKRAQVKHLENVIAE